MEPFRSQPSSTTSSSTPPSACIFPCNARLFFRKKDCLFLHSMSEIKHDPSSFFSGSIILIVLLFRAVPFSLSQSQQASDYLEFTFDATEFPAEEEYDYIIVGGGTAGCSLAATLSEEFRVLLLERGGSSNMYPNLMSKEGFLQTLMDTDRHDSPAQEFWSEDGVPNARGRVLGGSSAINAGFYSRADADFFKNSGPVNWDMDLVNRSFEWVERAVVFRPELRRWQSAVLDSLLDANVTPFQGFTVEHVNGTKIGGSLFDRSGRRHSAADLLSYAKPENLTVALHASVEMVLLAAVAGTQAVDDKEYSSSFRELKPTAIGVIYGDRKDSYHQAMLRSHGEVILSAGALGSPQLLLLSGIGPGPYLSSMGIPVAHHSPFVGQFLYDNPRNGISIVSSVALEQSLIQVAGITSNGSFIEAASSILPFYPAHNPAFIFPNPPSPVYVPVATLMEKVAGPLSFGSLRLASVDVRQNPLVRFNYFSHPDDLAVCVRGMRKVAQVLQAQSMEQFKFTRGTRGTRRRGFRFVGPSLPANLLDDAAMADFCRRTVTTIWHYHGGCVAGKVVDGEYRVIGVGALRVIDGSTFLRSPGTNPQATVMMLGRYMGRKMIDSRT